jgi:hypothetical protein
VDFLKFIALSIAAVVLLIIAGGLGLYLEVSEGLPFGDLIGSISAIVVAGVAFALVPPRHLKFGYAVWIVASIILFMLCRWGVDIALRADPRGEENPAMIGLGMGVIWLVTVIAVNPVCYWFGKRVANFLLPSEDESLARHFD